MVVVLGSFSGLSSGRGVLACCPPSLLLVFSFSLRGSGRTRWFYGHPTLLGVSMMVLFPLTSRKYSWTRDHAAVDEG